MRHPWFLKSKWLVGIPLLGVLVFALACGADEATPVVIEKEVVVEKEVVKEVIKEVVVEKEVIKEVVVEKEVAVVVQVTPTPVPSRFGIVADATYGDIARMVSVGDVRGWDPHKHGRAEDIQANGLAYNQLVEYDPLNVTQIIGDLAIDWDVSDDFLRYTFRIEKGVQWHDGIDLTADDVVYSIERLIREGTSRAGLFRPYMSENKPAEKLDTYTIRLNLKQPSDAFLRFLAVDFNKMVPRHTAGAGDDLELYENYMGSGPWVPVSWDEGVSSEWEANPNYFKEGRPFFGGIQGFVVADPGIEIAAYKTERVLMSFATGNKMGIDDALRLGDDEEFMAIHDLFWLTGVSHANIMVNSKSPPFDKPEARRAVWLATDRWEFVEGFGKGTWGVGTAMTFKNPYALPIEEIMQLPGYRRSPDGSKPQEDIAEAIRLLNSIGFNASNPMKFELIGSSLSYHADAATLLKDQFKRFGLPVDITLEGGEIGAVVGQAIDGDYQMMILGCGVTIPDPDDSFALCYMPTGRNWSRYTEPGVEELFYKQQVEPDTAKRREINYEMQRLIYNGSPSYIEHSSAAFFSFVNKRVRTEKGKWLNRVSSYTVLKHEHEWLLPKGSAIPE